MPKRQRKQLPKQFFITDQSRIDAIKVIPCLPKDTAIIFRDYDNPDRENLGKTIKSLCKARNLPFLVAKDYKLALKLKADGVHLPEFAINKAIYIRQIMPKWLITSAAHSIPAVVSAKKAHIDAILISPVFPTKSHPNSSHLGIIRAQNMIISGVKAYSLGGITVKNVTLVKTSRFQGFAGISWPSFCGLNDTK